MTRPSYGDPYRSSMDEEQAHRAWRGDEDDYQRWLDQRDRVTPAPVTGLYSEKHLDRGDDR